MLRFISVYLDLQLLSKNENYHEIVYDCIGIGITKKMRG